MSYRNYFSAISDTQINPSFTSGVGYYYDLFDINRDGLLDLLVLGASFPTHTNEATPRDGILYWGQPDGKFKLATNETFQIPQTVHPRAIIFADFNSDSMADIFIADHGWDASPFPGAQNQLILSSGESWGIASDKLPQADDFTHSVAVGDINGDGNLDLFLGNTWSSSLSKEARFLFGDGKGNFIETQDIVPGSLLKNIGSEWIRFFASELTDLDGDGLPELIVGDSGDSYSSFRGSVIFWNQGGSFSDDRRTILPNGVFGAGYEHVLDIDAADIDGDGEKEILINFTLQNPRYIGWGLQIFKKSNGAYVDISSTAFGEDRKYFEGTPGIDNGEPWLVWAHLVDVNKDGSVDILLDTMQQSYYETEGNSARPALFLNDGFGHFKTITQSDILDLNATGPNSLSGLNWFTRAVAEPTEDGILWVYLAHNNGTFYFRITTEIQLLPSPAPSSPNRKGTDGDDYVFGDSRANILFGGTGNDTLVGGFGFDTVEYAISAHGYRISFIDGELMVQDVVGSDGTDRLSSVERIKFSDLTLNLTIREAAEQADQIFMVRLMELYVAFFNRVPDADGLEYWIGQIQAGQSINSIAESFYSAGVQYTDLTGFSSTMTNSDFVNVIYRNVLGRTDGADADGLAYWTEQLASGNATRGSLVSSILDSAHTFKGNATWGWVADLLDNKIAVSQQFAVNWGLNYNTPEDSIAKGMAIAAAITPTDTDAAIALIGIAPGQIILG